jgi:hypothetical protein
MNYSIGHEAFAENLNRHIGINTQDVLDNPEKYLGPNYKEVLNWWFYWGSLSEQQKSVYNGRLIKIEKEAWRKAIALYKNLASEVIDHRFVDHLWGCSLEIIAAHLYIERGIQFTFLPVFFEL